MSITRQPLSIAPQPSTVTVDATLNTNGAYSGLPRWVRVIGILGFPSAVAAYLLWVFVGGLPTKVEAIQKDISAHVIQTAQHSAEFKAFEDNHQRTLTAILQVLQQQCVSIAIQAGRNTDVCFPSKDQGPQK